MLVASAISFATSLTNRLLTNREQLRDWNKEVSQWRTDSMKAARSGDKKLMAKVKKQEQHIMQLQSKMMWQSMKTSFLWFVPLLLIWYLFLSPIFGPLAAVAYLPGLFGSQSLQLPLFWWYLLSSFMCGILFSRLFGLALGGD
jgi:uncharacterized membrane protein (DUF106 family)